MTQEKDEIHIYPVFSLLNNSYVAKNILSKKLMVHLMINLLTANIFLISFNFFHKNIC